MDKTVFDRTLIPLLSKGLDVAVLRQRTTAANIANTLTPGFNRLEVVFEEKLQRALDTAQTHGTRTHPDHRPLGQRDLDQITPDILQPDDNTLPSGVNNVDVDHEMSELAKNQLWYDLNAKLLSRNFQTLRASIQGHRR